MRHLIWIFAILFSASPLFAMEDYKDSDYELGSGFISVEGGFMHILSPGKVSVYDAPMGYLNLGFSLTHEFRVDHEIDTLKIGPKIGFGIGEIKSTNTVETFYDLLLKVRYYFGPSDWVAQPYLDAGPGIISYHDKAFQAEGGLGFEFVFGRSTVGVNGQYKEVIGSDVLNRSVVVLGTLGYHF